MKNPCNLLYLKMLKTDFALKAFYHIYKENALSAKLMYNLLIYNSLQGFLSFVFKFKPILPIFYCDA